MSIVFFRSRIFRRTTAYLFTRRFFQGINARREFAASAWKEGVRLVRRSAPGFQKSLMYFRAKGLNRCGKVYLVLHENDISNKINLDHSWWKISFNRRTVKSPVVNHSLRPMSRTLPRTTWNDSDAKNAGSFSDGFGMVTSAIGFSLQRPRFRGVWNADLKCRYYFLALTMEVERVFSAKNCSQYDTSTMSRSTLTTKSSNPLRQYGWTCFVLEV